MKEYNNELIYGKHPVMDAIRAGTSFEKVIIQSGARLDFDQEIRRLCKDHDIPFQYAPKEKLNKMVKGNHQGLIGRISLLVYHSLETLLGEVLKKTDTPLFIVLDGVTDVRNFGAIARSAEVFGAHGIIIGKKNSARVNAEAMKTSAGALSRIPVCRENSIGTSIYTLKDAGIQIAAADLKAEQSISDVDFKVPLAVIVGDEAKGVSLSRLNKSDIRFKIPQLGETDSLNVSVATGVVLYEITRQRQG